MDPLQVLKQSISSLFDQLNEAETAVDAAVACYEAAQVAPRAYHEDEELLRAAIEACRGPLRLLKAQSERLGNPPAKTQRSWWEKLAEVRSGSAVPMAECLAFALGPLVRGIPWQNGRGLDNGFCDIADEMLKELSIRSPENWNRRTVLSDFEFIADPAQIIRIRFPVTSIWDLPVAAHEFGHLLGHGSRSQLKPRIEALARDYQERNWVHEHFADLFATYVMGPAFACTCLLTRFDPSMDPSVNSETHPSHGARAAAIVWALSEMETEIEPATRTMSTVSRLVDETWRACLADASDGRDTRISERQDQLLKRWLPELYKLVVEACPRSKYTQWDSARKLDESAGSVGEILNAAWYAHVHQCRDSFEVEATSRHAVEMCGELIRRRNEAGT
jgi:hypothetical protein